MCLILLAWQAHPDFPLVVAANRDEFFARPTAAADFWPEASGVVAGRDLEAGGTWMGVTRSGRFAALTNFRAPEHQLAGRPSRGRLVADFLESAVPPADFLGHNLEQRRRCNAYNLLVGDREEMHWESSVTGEQRRLAPGIYGLSNHLLDTPWPKVGAGRTALAAALAHLPDTSSLFHLLADDRRYPDPVLPSTGVPLEWERLLSAAFIRSADYGTRSSTVLCARRDGWVSYDEKTWNRNAAPGGRRRYRFPIA